MMPDDPILTKFREARWATLPLEDMNVFWYEDPHGTKHEAVAYCKQYFQLIERFFAEVQRGAWRRVDNAG